MKPVRVVHRQIWRESGLSLGSRSITEETAVALTYNGGTYAVMMATPQDLQDFAVGFSLNEGVINSAGCASACVRCGERGDHTSHQPGFSRDGAEKCCHCARGRI